ncbi:Methylmalonyl-CoA mutase [Azospirillum melinis]
MRRTSTTSGAAPSHGPTMGGCSHDSQRHMAPVECSSDRVGGAAGRAGTVALPLACPGGAGWATVLHRGRPTGGDLCTKVDRHQRRSCPTVPGDDLRQGRAADRQPVSTWNAQRTAWRIRRLEQEARRLAAEIQARPIVGAADILARLDIVAAMWGPDGTISEPGAPLAEMLALLDEIARSAPGFQPTWRRCRGIMRVVEPSTKQSSAKPTTACQ